MRKPTMTEKPEPKDKQSRPSSSNKDTHLGSALFGIHPAVWCYRRKVITMLDKIHKTQKYDNEENKFEALLLLP